MRILTMTEITRAGSSQHDIHHSVLGIIKSSNLQPKARQPCRPGMSGHSTAARNVGTHHGSPECRDTPRQPGMSGHATAARNVGTRHGSPECRDTSQQPGMSGPMSIGAWIDKTLSVLATSVSRSPPLQTRTYSRRQRSEHGRSSAKRVCKNYTN
jgi:hypothetical protein